MNGSKYLRFNVFLLQVIFDAIKLKVFKTFQDHLDFRNIRYSLLGILMLYFVIGNFGNMATFLTLKYEKGLRTFTKIMLCMVTFWDILRLIVDGLYWYHIIRHNLDVTKVNFSLNPIACLMIQVYLIAVFGICLLPLSKECVLSCGQQIP